MLSTDSVLVVAALPLFTLNSSVAAVAMAGTADEIEMLARLMAAARSGESRAQNRVHGIDFGRFGRLRSREELLADHASSREELMPQKCNLSFSTTDQSNVKPNFPVPPAVASLTPVHAHSLVAETTRRGRILRGTLAVQPVVLASVQTLLEDELGDLVSVCFYNALPAVPPDRSSQWHAAEQLFPRGRKVAIIEPFFKLARDGTYLVRVDDPREVVWLDRLGPDDADGWRAEGAVKDPCLSI